MTNLPGGHVGTRTVFNGSTTVGGNGEGLVMAGASCNGRNLTGIDRGHQDEDGDLNSDKKRRSGMTTVRALGGGSAAT